MHMLLMVAATETVSVVSPDGLSCQQHLLGDMIGHLFLSNFYIVLY